MGLIGYFTLVIAAAAFAARIHLLPQVDRSLAELESLAQ